MCYYQSETTKRKIYIPPFASIFTMKNEQRQSKSDPLAEALRELPKGTRLRVVKDPIEVLPGASDQTSDCFSPRVGDTLLVDNIRYVQTPDFSARTVVLNSTDVPPKVYGIAFEDLYRVFERA